MRKAEKQRDLKTDLRNYRKNITRLEKVNAKLESLSETVAVQSSATENWRKQVRRVYGLPPTDEVRRLKAERKELWSATAMVEYWVAGIPEKRTREIFRRHFFQGETYAVLAANYGVQPESIRKIVQRKIKSP